MSQELKNHRCCFTGHRPEKLTADSATIQEALVAEVDKTIASGITEFITGRRVALIYGQPSWY